MRLYKRKDTTLWWDSWIDRNARPTRRSSGTDNRKLAEALTSKWVQEDFLDDHFGKKPELPFSEALLRYAKAQKRDHARHFMTKTRYRLRYFAARFDGWNVSDFTFGAAQKFVDERLETVSTSFVIRDLALIKSIINKARREELTDFVPNFPRLKTPKPRNRWLTTQEEARLVTAAAPHLKALIRFAVDTGGRRSELLGLDWRYVDLDQKRVTFPDTKNGEDRSVRLCKRAEATLRDLGPKDCGPVFTFQGKAIKCIKKGFDAARTRAGVEDIRFHDLRHTFASRLVQGGVPLYEVMSLTGHKSLEMVQRYAHLAPDFQDRAISALDNLCHDLVTVEESEDLKKALSH
ncbi:MAG: site-specific integrase [Rhodospirillales bacterium]